MSPKNNNADVDRPESSYLISQKGKGDGGNVLGEISSCHDSSVSNFWLFPKGCSSI